MATAPPPEIATLRARVAAIERHNGPGDPRLPDLKRNLETRTRLNRIDDPLLAEEIAYAAIERARELMAEGPFPQEFLDRVAALVGPIPPSKAPAAAGDAEPAT